ncbi:MAG: ABC transporter permease [Clostridiales bacterium]|uniref:ABC transporter permease n=1 Tax=uncultured Intestinibacter sp. TaxID=1505659 RepID=UPI0025EE111D|nr:ABC transporter permease [uncultured Intestinibacter sp.]MDU1203004.1 ABC transporter permease [Clostridiales bacterium]
MNKGIGKFLTKKVLKLITLLVALCIITFVLMELSPIDPVTAYVGASTKVSAEQRQLIAEHWGLNQPPIIRFWSWFKSIISGDWGTSMIYRRPVLEVIGQKFMSSIWLMGISWILSGIIGFILGIIAGIKEGKLIDKIIRGYCYIIMSTPTFWLGILFIILFSVKLGWFPVALSVPIGVLSENVGFVERMQHIILPALTLSIISISSICMNTRQKVIEIMESDYILFAKARGESQISIIFNHVLKNVSLPAITLQFLSFSELFGGTIFVEQVFSYPGLGQATVSAGLKGDLPLLMGIAIISLVFVYSGNIIADLLYRVIDPRIKEGQNL